MISPSIRPKIIAIGVSTGGPVALRHILGKISPQIDIPIVIVQHIKQDFVSSLVRNLNQLCVLPVKEAQDGEALNTGCVLIAPGDCHTTVSRFKGSASIRLVDSPPVNGHKPSVGVLFDSVAEQFGSDSAAIIMTGMGRDGSLEIGKVYDAGGIALAQDEESSVVFGMPGAAIEQGRITEILPLNAMAESINRMTSL